MYFSRLVAHAGSFLLLLGSSFAAPVTDQQEPTRTLDKRICCGLGEPIIPAPKKSPSPTPSGTATASTPIRSGGYWSEIEVDIANIKFNLLFDSGSPRLLLCGVPGVGNPLTTYPLTAAQKNGNQFSISYDDGTTDTGVEVVDTVTIGGLSTSMTISVSTTCAMGNRSDGIIGVSFGGDKPNYPLAVANVLQQPTFVMNMGIGLGTLRFGVSPDSSQYINEIKTVNIDSSISSWGVKDVTFTVGSVSDTGDMSMDTGTSYTEVSSTIVDAYHAQISGSIKGNDGKWTIPCDASNLPDLGFSDPNNSGYSHIIPGGSFLGNTQAKNMCQSLLVTATHGIWFPGWAFWSTHYTWFDTQAMTMQFAQDVPDQTITLAVTQQIKSVVGHNLPPPSIAEV